MERKHKNQQDVGKILLFKVEEYYRGVGLQTDLLTMKKSVVQRVFQGLVSEKCKVASFTVDPFKYYKRGL